MKYSAEDFADMIGAFRRQVAGVLRKMAIKLTDGGSWQVAGHTLFSTRTREAPVTDHFPGIGIAARPPAGSASAEAIVAQVGGPNDLVIIAARDEETRAKVTDIGANETVTYNSECRLFLRSDGSIEARTHNGIAVPLCLHSDMVALKTQFAGWVVVPTDGGAALKALLTALIATGWPFGTTKLKGE